MQPADQKSVMNADPAARTWRRLIINKWMALFGIALMITSVGWYTHRTVGNAIKEDLAGDLQTILGADVAALRIWLENQIRVANAVTEEPEVTDNIHDLVDLAKKNGLDRETLLASRTLQNLRSILARLCRIHGYADFLVIGSDGYNLCSLTSEPIGERTVPGRSDFFSRALSGQTVVSEPFLSTLKLPDQEGAMRTHHPTMFVAAPVRDRHSRIIAVLGLRIRPEKDFTRILQVARAGRSGETYAFNSRGLMISHSRFEKQLRKIGLLNDREQPHSILNVDIRDPGGNMLEGYRSLPRDQLPLTRMAQSAISGHSGVDVNGYRDYRGVPVAGAWEWLDAYGFGVATEEDLAEALSPLRVLRQVFGVLFGLLLITVLGITVSSRIIFIQRHRMKRLGQYTLERKIGKGGLGSVYKASHAMLRRPTALKLLSLKHTKEEDIARFKREVQFSSQLTHPNTIRIYDYGRTPDGLFYYAMEYLPGINLWNLVEKFGPQVEARVIHILLQVCASLEEAHGLGLIHRDIKPENIILCERGGNYDVIKVLDFGLVKYLPEKGKTDEIISEKAVGTPQYLAPEAIMTPEKTDERTDLYAIGAVAYYLLSGTDVFPGKDPIEVCRKQINDAPPPPSEKLERALSRDLEKVILSCLEKDPADRPQNATQLTGALKKCVDYGKWGQAEASECWEKHQRDGLITDALLEPLPRGHEERVSIDLMERIRRQEKISQSP